MSDTDYRIRIKIGADGTEIEAQGDKAFVQEVLAEFQTKGAEMLPKGLPRSFIEEEKVPKPIESKKPREEKAKVQTRKVPSRRPKYLIERREIVDKVMKDSVPSDPPYRVAMQNAKDVEHQCAYVLLLLKEKYEVDGLSASELAAILTKRFSLPAKADTLGKKLKKWPTHVDTVVKGRIPLFQLTPGGTDDIRHSLQIDGGQFQPRPIEEMMTDEQ